jgi:nitrogen fixation/metabolism regulation signal transduction histidine kinase
MARDFLSGATETAKNYAESMLNKITMGNLYWGSLSNPQATINMNKLGSNLTQMGLDNTVGKEMQRGLGSIKSSVKQAKAAAFGWNTSVGSNLSGNVKSPAIETFGHRP